MYNIDSIFTVFPELEINNFLLRQIKAKDFSDIYELYSDPSMVQYQQTEPMKTIDEAKQIVITFLEDYINHKFIRWCIADKTSDKVIGLIVLHSFKSENLKAELGYMLNKNYQRQNIMTQCAKKVITFAFKDIGLKRLEVSINPENICSLKTAKKLGFTEECLRKHIAYNVKTNSFEDRLILSLINEN